jgi:hypothetical protein
MGSLAQIPPAIYDTYTYIYIRMHIYII